MTTGIFAIYKPTGMTSHDVVNRVRRATGVKRVGHGGTLDPLASGILIIAVGRENTKQIEKFVKGEKEYIAEIKLGEVSATDDAEGPIEKFQPKQIIPNQPPPSENDIERVIQKFIGIFPQTPPIYSAKKIKGTTSYRLARRGMNIKLEPKNIEIMRIELLSYDYPIVKIRVKTGPGAYIRSLARDIGQELMTGAYLFSLERTRVGNFTKTDCITLDQLPNLRVTE